jgi:holliday junction DNA helicase RuvA
MISALTGELRDVGEDRVRLQVGALLFELLVPAADTHLLQAGVGSEMTFHTLFYLQGEASGGYIEPRLIGFLRPDDREFFELFITVKNIGPRKALRAFAVPTGEIAHAIEMKDTRFLIGLPEIGKRTAEQIVAELSGKCGRFVSVAAGTRSSPAPAASKRSADEEDAILTLIALGERRVDAEQLLDRAKLANPKLVTAETLVREMLRLRPARA